jgi:hypothetical protein
MKSKTTNLKTSSKMKIESLYFLIQSGEGFSVRPDGYLTYVGDGYAVGGVKGGKVFTLANEILSFNTFSTQMARLATYSPDSSQVIGGWVDDDGIVYLEVSDIVKSKSVALELAEARGEKAIYDFANAKSIDL